MLKSRVTGPAEGGPRLVCILVAGKAPVHGVPLTLNSLGSFSPSKKYASACVSNFDNDVPCLSNVSSLVTPPLTSKASQ